jgi:hypothetical protein
MLMNIATKVIVDMREFRWDNHICLVTKSGQNSVAVRDPTLNNVPDLASFSVSDPYSFFTDPDPVDPDGGQYGSGSNPDPIRIQGFNDQKLKKK